MLADRVYAPSNMSLRVAPMMLHSIDRQGLITEVSDMWLSKLGYTWDEVIGHPSVEFLTEESARYARDVVLPEFFASGRCEVEYEMRHKDGSILPVRLHGIAVRSESGAFERSIAVIEDLTERRALERAMVDSGIASWEVDVPRRTVSFSQRWLERFGYDESTVTRDWAWWASTIHPDDVARTQAAFQDCLDGTVSTFRVEYRMRSVAGTWAWILSSGKITTRDPAGLPLQVIGICVDITERKALDERLLASERLVALGTLAAGVGHEINNPLTFITLNLTLLEREIAAVERREVAPASRMRELLAELRDGAERVAAIVRDLKSLSRRGDDEVADIDPNAIVERCLQIADHQVRHRARVIRDLGHTPHVRSNEGRMVQMLLNLIVNAAQAIPDGAADRHWIRVATSTSPDGRAVLEVSDNGTGISEQDVKHIFEPFFTTKAAEAGTGLGLAISRDIATKLGGEIEVESALGRGTTLRVLLPPSQTTERASKPSPSPVRGLRLLVIDDEPSLGRLVAAVLDNCNVTVETSARAALARLRAGEAFDRILCDVMMPDLSGMDFYEQLAPALRPRVVFISGGAFTERSRRFIDSVPNRKLDKPFSVQQLLAVLAD
jgi:PAS domain S-box-containing protein